MTRCPYYFAALEDAMSQAEEVGLDPYSDAVAVAAMNQRNERMADAADMARKRRMEGGV